MRVGASILAGTLLTLLCGCGEHYEGGGRRTELPSGGTQSSGGGPTDAVGEAGEAGAPLTPPTGAGN